jgi:hypothetical protein
MADLQQVMSALRNAHAAGDTDSARRLAQIADQLRSGQYGVEPEPVKRTLLGQAGELFRGIPRGAIGLLETAATGASALLPEGPEQSAREAIARVGEAAAAPFQPKPGYEDSMVAKFGEAAGSTLPFFAAGPFGLAGRAAATGLGAAAGAGEARGRAEEGGATDEERALSTGLGSLVGLSEVIVPFRILKNAVGEVPASGVLNRLRRAAQAGGEEGLQEAAAEVAQNLIERGVYNPEQGVFTDTGESFGYGAGVGGLAQALFDLFAPGRAGRGAPSPRRADVEETGAPAIEPAAAAEPLRAVNVPVAMSGGGENGVMRFTQDPSGRLFGELVDPDGNVRMRQPMQAASPNAFLDELAKLEKSGQAVDMQTIVQAINTASTVRREPTQESALDAVEAPVSGEVPAPSITGEEFTTQERDAQVSRLRDSLEKANQHDRAVSYLENRIRVGTPEQVATARRQLAELKKIKVLSPQERESAARQLRALETGAATSTRVEQEAAGQTSILDVLDGLQAEDAALATEQQRMGDLFPSELESATSDERMVGAAMARRQAREDELLAADQDATETAEMQDQEQGDMLGRFDPFEQGRAVSEQTSPGITPLIPFTPLTKADLDAAKVPKGAPVRKRVVDNNNPAQVKSELEALAANPNTTPEVAASVTELAESIPAAPAEVVTSTEEVPISSVPSYHMESWKEQTGLSEEDIARYWKLADDQRGKPEFAMVAAQRVMSGGALDPVIEHIGDLTNRMGPKHSPGFSYEETKGKAEKYLKSLRSGYGFRREFEENLVSNAKFLGKPLEQHKADVDAALKAYANAHAELKTYNPIQTAARDAAVALGNKEFEKAADLLENMLGMMQDQDQFFLNLRPSTPTSPTSTATAKPKTETKPKAKVKKEDAPLSEADFERAVNSRIDKLTPSVARQLLEDEGIDFVTGKEKERLRELKPVEKAMLVNEVLDEDSQIEIPSKFARETDVAGDIPTLNRIIEEGDGSGRGQDYILIHAGGDFTDPDSRFLGMGEGRGMRNPMRPLGKGLYGYLVRTPAEAEKAIQFARMYLKYAPTEEKAIHAFRVSVAPGEAVIKSPLWADNLLTKEQQDRRAEWESADAIPPGPERLAAYAALRKKYPSKSLEEQRAEDAKFPYQSELLPGLGLVEFSVQDLSRLERVGKWSPDTDNKTIASELPSNFSREADSDATTAGARAKPTAARKEKPEPDATSTPTKDATQAQNEQNVSFAKHVKESKTIKDLLGRISRDKTVPPQLRALAKTFQQVAQNINMPVVIEDMDGANVLGQYVHPQQGDERIVIDPRQPSMAQTFLHEFVHPLTVEAIARNTTEGQRVAALWAEYKEKHPESRAYGFDSAYEFIAEGLTNPKFKALLVKNNFWSKFVDTIRRAIGLPPSQSAVFRELLDLTVTMGTEADKKAALKREEQLTEAFDKINTPEGNQLFLRVADDAIRAMANNPKTASATRAMHDTFTKAGRKGKETLLWGLHMNSLNDLVQNNKTASAGFKKAMSLYSSAMHRGEGTREVFAQSAGVTIDRQNAFANKATAEQREAFTDLVYAANEARVDLRYPESRYSGDAEKLAAYRKLKSKNGLWNKIGADGQQLYRMRRQVFDNQLKQITETIQSGVQSMTDDKKLATAITNKFMQELQQGGIDGYEPMTRPDGDYKLSYFTKEKGAPELGYEIFSSKLDRDMRAEQLEKDPLIVKGTISKADRMDRQIEEMLGTPPSNSFVGELMSIMENAKVNKDTQRAVLEAAAAMSPSRSVAKRLMLRKDTPGYTRDPFLAFNRTVVGTGRQLEALRHGSQVRSALKGLQEEYKKMDSPEELAPLMRELTARTKFASNPTLPNWSNMAKTATFAWTLGFNLSSPIVDAMSLVLITYPHLQKKYGRVKALGYMSDAVKTVLGSGTDTKIETLLTKDFTDAELKSPEIKKMLDDMGMKGRDFEASKAFPSILNHDYSDPKLDKETSELKELNDELLIHGHSQRFSTLTEAVEVGESSGLSKVNAYMGILMHSAERFKREVTTVAQYKAELDKKRSEGVSITAEVRRQAAQDAVRDSLMLNGGSSSLTKPGYTQSPGWSIIGMYKQYGSLQYYLQGRLLNDMFRSGVDKETKSAAWSQWLMMSAMSAAFAGVRGIPLMGVVFATYNMFADDEEDDAETKLRKIIGTPATEGIFGSLLNMNIGPRIEYTNMLVRDTELPEGRSLWDIGVALFGGPTAGSINRAARGVSLIQDGNIERGIESLLPVALSNILKAVRFQREGALTLRGDPVLDEVGAGALASQFMGFAPADYARAMDFTGRQKKFEVSVNTKRNRLYERAYVAYRTNDTAGYLDVMQDIVKFNAQHPNRAIRAPDLRQSIMTRDRNTQNMRMGRLPGSGFEGRWESEAEDWGF